MATSTPESRPVWTQAEPVYDWEPIQTEIPTSLEYIPLVLSATDFNKLETFFDGQVPTVGDIVSLVCYRDETVNGKQSLSFKLKVTGRVEN